MRKRNLSVQHHTACQRKQPQNRKGAILVLASVMLSIMLVIAAFTVDLGMISVTKGQLQNASDSATHAAMQELARSYGASADLTASQAEASARSVAVSMVARFRTADVASTIADGSRDVRFGNRTWDAANNSWTQTWGVAPFNMVEVSPKRTAAANAAVPMTFARLLGVSHHNVSTKAVAAVVPASGFRMNQYSSESLDILPIAVDLGTWDKLVAANTGGLTNGFSDSWRWDGSSGTLSPGTDTIRELNIYPDLNTSLPAGNRGTVDLGSANNSTADLKRQITDGLNEYDLSFFPNGELNFSFEQPLMLNGDTGISAGIENSLSSIIGQNRAIPIFTTASGPGNTAMYSVVKFVGVRIVAVKLSGDPRSRYLLVQPSSFSTPHIIRGKANIEYDSIVSAPFMIQ